MEWTCKKCGKTLEVSEEQLSETKGVIVCPQCLSSDNIPGYSRKTVPTRQSNKPAAQTATQPSHRPKPQSAMKASPPPYRKKINFTDDSSATKTQNNTTAARKKNKKRKSKKRGPLAPHSPMGCLWRSFIYTLIFLATITALGFFFDYI